jgi:hypothetical protein
MLSRIDRCTLEALSTTFFALALLLLVPVEVPLQRSEFVRYSEFNWIIPGLFALSRCFSWLATRRGRIVKILQVLVFLGGYNAFRSTCRELSRPDSALFQMENIVVSNKQRADGVVETPGKTRNINDSP